MIYCVAGEDTLDGHMLKCGRWRHDPPPHSHCFPHQRPPSFAIRRLLATKIDTLEQTLNAAGGAGDPDEDEEGGGGGGKGGKGAKAGAGGGGGPREDDVPADAVEMIGSRGGASMLRVSLAGDALSNFFSGARSASGVSGGGLAHGVAVGSVAQQTTLHSHFVRAPSGITSPSGAGGGGGGGDGGVRRRAVVTVVDDLDDEELLAVVSAHEANVAQAAPPAAAAPAPADSTEFDDIDDDLLAQL